MGGGVARHAVGHRVPRRPPRTFASLCGPSPQGEGEQIQHQPTSRSPAARSRPPPPRHPPRNTGHAPPRSCRYDWAQSAASRRPAAPPDAPDRSRPPRAPDRRAARSRRRSSRCPGDVQRQPEPIIAAAPPRCCGPSTAPARRHRPARVPGRRPITLVSTVTAMSSMRVRADLRLEQVAEHVDAGTHFGDAVERSPHAARSASCPSRRSAPRTRPRAAARAARTTPDAFRLRDPRHVARRCGRHRNARHASSRPARRPPSRSADRQQRIVVRADAAALLAAVDLDQRARRPRMRGDRAGGVQVVGDAR